MMTHETAWQLVQLATQITTQVLFYEIVPYFIMHQKYFMHTFHFVTENIKKYALKSQGMREFLGGLVLRILAFH